MTVRIIHSASHSVNQQEGLPGPGNVQRLVHFLDAHWAQIDDTV